MYLFEIIDQINIISLRILNTLLGTDLPVYFKFSKYISVIFYFNKLYSPNELYCEISIRTYHPLGIIF